jgi:DNA-binding Lrp family transcriptional regulator
MIALDDLDCSIVTLLQADARMSSRDMTRRLGDVSDRVVRYRIKRLLDSQVVLLQAMVDPRNVGYPFIADVLIDVEPHRLAEVWAKVAAIESVASANSSRSGGQLSIQVNARDEGDLAAFVRNRLPQIDGILCVQCMAVPLLIKDLAFWKPPAVAAFSSRNYGEAEARSTFRSLANEAGRSSSAGPKPEDRELLDELDTGVVNLLQEQPLMSSREMSSRLDGVPDRVVRYRVRRLLDRGAMLIQARLNPHKVGYPVVADVFVEVVPWKLVDAGAKLAGMEQVCYVSAARPGRDGRELSIEVNARNDDDLVAFVRHVLPRVDGIVNARTVIVPRLAKDVATWQLPRTV